MERKFNLYYIKEEYINYLRQFDKRVQYNKNQTRPYVGIVCIFKGQKYFIPMSSPKEKHLTMSDRVVDIYKIDGGRLGILNINNMIPANIDVIQKLNPNEHDNKYENLLYNQINFINQDRETVIMKIKKFFNLYDNNTLYENIRERTCDFYLLEEMCREWNNINKNSNLIKEDNSVYNGNPNDYRVFPY